VAPERAWHRLGAAVAAVVLASSPATALGAKNRFEPTDLELEDPGVLDVDLQFGALRSAGPWRAVTPDVEIDLGLTRNVELDVDFAYAVEGPERGAFSFDHVRADNLWLSAKVGLFGRRNASSGAAWSVGLQLGPKLPLAPDAHGVGYEALLLVGRTFGRLHTVLNAGGLVDPGAQVSRGRPIGVELGLDLRLALDDKDRFSILGQVGSILYVSSDPHELHASSGLRWSPSERLDLSLMGLVGLPPGSDRYGVLLGVSPKFQLWK